MGERVCGCAFLPFSLLYCDAFGVNDRVSEGVCFHPTPLKMLCIIVLVITVFCRFNHWYPPQIVGYRDLNTISWDMFVDSAKLCNNQHVSLINNAITLGIESFSNGSGQQFAAAPHCNSFIAACRNTWLSRLTSNLLKCTEMFGEPKKILFVQPGHF